MSQLQARRADFAAWCAERQITDDDEKSKHWITFCGGWEACADRVWGQLERALSDIKPAEPSECAPCADGECAVHPKGSSESSGG